MSIKLHIKNFGIETCLKFIALIVAISTFLKSIIDVDKQWDTWVYHLPFAARIWGIVPAEIYGLENHEEHRFDGFPILAEFLQGFFWYIFQHVQAANLVSFLSLVLFICFLKVYFRVPLYLSAIALLAIPLVLTHATICYVDLPGNIGISILVMMTYLLYKQNNFPTKRNLLVIFLAAASAANIKPQLQPLVFLILCFIGLRIIWLHFKLTKASKKWLLKTVSIALVASVLIFATPIKNIVLYGNPFYPVRIEVAGIVLNHKTPLYNAAPDYLKETPRSQRWLYSILEVNSAEWSPDQYSGDPNQNRMGGFFGAYVVFNLLLLVRIFFSDRCPETTTAVISVVIMSIVAANFPQSHELRYFMYWMISLVSINLYLVSRYERSPNKLRWLKPKYIGLVSTLFLFIVLSKIGNPYARPTFYTLDQHLQERVKPEILKQINPGDEVCLVGKQPDTFLYTSKFHPQLDYSYSLEAAGVPKLCLSKEKIL